ncbi:MAG: cobalamin/Fe(3+)-siderophore ABC transporter ATP-binding protein [Shinella sp.]|nr:MAG: cobalamin/Fe(3+)-siderophore ABC transporter ATP-binding protein [Shinella sp.]
MAADHAPLEARDVCVRYGDVTALTDVSVLVPEGKLTVLAGPNGSGKSTLLSALSRVLTPTGGSVLLDGRVISQIPTREVARSLGLLPQAPLVPEGMSVYDLVSRGRYPHQGILKQWSDADECAVMSAITVTGLEALAGRLMQHLSGGQRQRAFIAMTLAQETRTILFDEPTTFLDLRYQAEVMDLIDSLCRDHRRTIVVVLHDLNAALQHADRLIFLKDGRIHSVLDDVQECSTDLIADVFETRVVRVDNPDTGRPAFLPRRHVRQAMP